MFSAQKNAAPASGKLFVEDVFSTYLYTGNGSTQTIYNGIEIGSGPVNGTVFQLTGTSFTDVAPVPKTITTFSSPTINTSVIKYTSGSIYLNGTSQYLTAASSSDFEFPANTDLTVEGWFYWTGLQSYSHFFQFGTSLTNRWNVYSAGGTFSVFSYAGGSSYSISTTTSVPSNQWFHLAVTRSGSTVRIFLNGTLIGSSSGFPLPTGSMPLALGLQQFSPGSSDYYQGYISDFRVIKGTARYTANFTPPTAALPIDTLTAGQGGLVWTKNRSAANSHYLWDTARGNTKRLSTDSTAAEGTTAGVFQFNSNGFSDGLITATGNNLASWTFRKAPKFFDVVTYTGNGAALQTINHNLGVAPGTIFVKQLNGTDDWAVYHRSTGKDAFLFLNSTMAAATGATDFWGTTAPNATSFQTSRNNNGGTYVAYLFAHDTTSDGIIQCGSFTSDGSGAASVTLGWEPQWLLFKRTDATQDWIFVDNMRGFSQSNLGLLNPNNSNAETQATGNLLFPTATGFQGNAGVFSANAPHIYIAIRRGPMRTPTNGTSVFSPVAYTGNSTSGRLVDTRITSDLSFVASRTYSVDKTYVIDRLRGPRHFLTSSTAAEDVNTNFFPSDSLSRQTGFTIGSDFTVNNSGWPFIGYSFRRAPSFFDEVCYTGDGGAYNPRPHNLGVTPELIINKNRGSTGSWWVKCSAGSGSTLRLETTGANLGSPGSLGTTTTFNPAVSDGTQTYVAYLFASCPGVSKVGSYTGNGSSQTINCGFAAGARFVMIKRTDSTGDWWFWDTARGIVASYDPALKFNSLDAEVSSEDSLDTNSSGFVVNQDTTVNINVNGATYIYLAVA